MTGGQKDEWVWLVGRQRPGLSVGRAKPGHSTNRKTEGRRKKDRKRRLTSAKSGMIYPLLASRRGTEKAALGVLGSTGRCIRDQIVSHDQAEKWAPCCLSRRRHVTWTCNTGSDPSSLFRHMFYSHFLIPCFSKLFIHSDNY